MWDDAELSSVIAYIREGDTPETEHNMEAVEARLVLQCQCDLDEFLKMVLLLLGSIDNILIAELLSPTASR